MVRLHQPPEHLPCGECLSVEIPQNTTGILPITVTVLYCIQGWILEDATEGSPWARLFQRYCGAPFERFAPSFCIVLLKSL